MGRPGDPSGGLSDDPLHILSVSDKHSRTSWLGNACMVRCVERHRDRIAASAAGALLNKSVMVRAGKTLQRFRIVHGMIENMPGCDLSGAILHT